MGGCFSEQGDGQMEHAHRGLGFLVGADLDVGYVARLILIQTSRA
jgi:hypothetical protein